MEDNSSLLFGPFRLDTTNEQLWRAGQVLTLRPKTFAVLRYLARHPEQLVTKDELLQAAWPQTVVNEAALTVCVKELRHVLRCPQDAAVPRDRVSARVSMDRPSSQWSVSSSQ
jgi:DNA-binding winged helix-turn-helix (wHTH) protein